MVVACLLPSSAGFGQKEVVPPLPDVAQDEIDAAVRPLFEAKEFAGLELLFGDARESRAQYSNGAWLIRELYGVVSSIRQEYGEEERGEFLAIVQEWEEQFPESVTPKTILTNSFVDYAWDERGSDSYRNLSSKQVDGFEHFITRAATTVRAGRRLDETDPEFFRAQIVVAMADSAEERAQWKLFEEAIVAYPYYRPTAEAMVSASLPRWGGNPRLVRRVASRYAEYTQDRWKDAGYYYVAVKVASSEGTDFDDYDLDWERIQQGFVARESLYGERAYHTRYMAWMACRYRDRSKAAFHFERFKDDDVTQSPWDARSTRAWREWALNDAERPNWQPIHEAARSGELAEVMTQLDDGVPVDAVDDWGRTPFALAMRGKKWAVARHLLDSGTDPLLGEDDEWPALSLAAYYGQAWLVRALLESGANVHERSEGGRAPVHTAVSRGYATIVDDLLNTPEVKLEDRTAEPCYGCSENPPTTSPTEFEEGNYYGETLLMEAISSDRHTLASALVAKGADVRAARNDGITVIAMAAEHSSPEFVEELISRGADPKQGDVDDWTPMHAAILEGRIEILRVLLAASNVDVNAKTRSGETPIARAAKVGSLPMLQLLLEHGADLSIGNQRGITPLARAEKAGQDHIVEYIRGLENQ